MSAGPYLMDESTVASYIRAGHVASVTIPEGTFDVLWDNDDEAPACWVDGVKPAGQWLWAMEALSDKLHAKLTAALNAMPWNDGRQA